MLIVAGFLTGLLVGLTGVGGGALMTPLLLLVFGFAPSVAVGTDLLFAGLTKSVAARIHYSRNLIDWKVVKCLWIGSLPSATLTLLLMQYLLKQSYEFTFLKVCIAVLIIIMAIGMILQKRLHAFGTRLRKSQAVDFIRWQQPLTIFAGILLGVLVTLTSIGAGALGAVFLVYLYPLRLTPDRLVATDVVHAIPLALFAGFGHMLMGNVNFSLLGTLLIGSIPGVVIGALLSTKVPHHFLRNIIAVILVLVGGKLLWTVI
jgi:uncharacterized membrane protein YfcA